MSAKFVPFTYLYTSSNNEYIVFRIEAIINDYYKIKAITSNINKIRDAVEIRMDVIDTAVDVIVLSEEIVNSSLFRLLF